ncbi:MMPL family transporter [Thermoleophilum album]|uniref:Putative drug exporter of the RND superfamily n=1 Tax=Thermoleophilum album TaxID=29539 RepID=A0A1H6FWG4_THEAL|nr:MMPL family transporter [Thermoleophilum album]SEH14508.1 putative drug exporter of the RND superfamily [Thermoleophilum album]
MSGAPDHQSPIAQGQHADSPAGSDQRWRDSAGPIGRLGVLAGRRRKLVAAGWAVLVLGLGVLAPRAEHALSGAGWEASGSESVAVRNAADKHFGGASSSALQVIVTSSRANVDDPRVVGFLRELRRTLLSDRRVRSVRLPQPGATIAQDRRTAVVQAFAAAPPDEMVRAAGALKKKIAQLERPAGVTAYLTGSSAMWSDFNEANKSAMLQSELRSWPVTLAILLVAFGSLVAAGLPLMLTIAGLVAAAGLLYLTTLAFDVSIWAMNFALMFSLALGIDYALFIVYRFRGALERAGGEVLAALRETMDTAGKAVLFSGLTVLVSLSAVLLVPSPAFRSMALGIMLSVVFVLAASLTLLPAVLAALGDRVDRFALPWVTAGRHRSPLFAAWGRRLWARPIAWGLPALLALAALCVPLAKVETGMPSIKVVPKDGGSRLGYAAIQRAFGEGAPGALQVVAPAARADEVVRVARTVPGVAAVTPPLRATSGDLALAQVIPTADPSSAAAKRTIDRLRERLPRGAQVGGAAAEYRDLEAALAARTVPVVLLVLGLGFLLLLVALRAPLVALVGVVTNLFATGAAFGVAKLIFQDGHLSNLLGFESQGFLDAWAPVFFFAMVFAISMDYSVFLLSSAREHRDRGESAREAMIGGIAHSGRVVLAAGAVMVAVFFTFALSGPLPPKEMGVILGTAVLLDVLLVRLLLVPVALRLLGERAWRVPGWLDRLLPHVHFGHGQSRLAPTPEPAVARVGS